MTARLLVPALPPDDEEDQGGMLSACSISNPTKSCAGAAPIVVFLYEGLVYNLVFLGEILPAVGKEASVLRRFGLFNASLGLALWSYLAARSSDPGRIPKRWQEFVSNVGEQLPIVPPRLEWQAGKATYCHMCGVPRPERAHHCKVCGHCVLRMDHHCPWLANCVGFKNHKFFLLAVAYGLLTSTLGFATALPELADCFGQLLGVPPQDSLPEGGQMNMESPWIWVFMLYGVVALMMIPILAAMFWAHMSLACSNTTTIEGHFSGDRNPFDQRSWVANLAQIFGDCSPDWILPVAPCRPRSDGVSFERNDLEVTPELRRHLVRPDIPPEWVWRARYRIRGAVTELEAFEPEGPASLGGMLSWCAEDQMHLIEPGDGRRGPMRVVSL